MLSLSRLPHQTRELRPFSGLQKCSEKIGDALRILTYLLYFPHHPPWSVGPITCLKKLSPIYRFRVHFYFSKFKIPLPFTSTLLHPGSRQEPPWRQAHPTWSCVKAALPAPCSSFAILGDTAQHIALPWLFLQLIDLKCVQIMLLRSKLHYVMLIGIKRN